MENSLTHLTRSLFFVVVVYKPVYLIKFEATAFGCLSLKPLVKLGNIVKNLWAKEPDFSPQKLVETKTWAKRDWILDLHLWGGRKHLPKYSICYFCSVCAVCVYMELFANMFTIDGNTPCVYNLCDFPQVLKMKISCCSFMTEERSTESNFTSLYQHILKRIENRNNAKQITNNSAIIVVAWTANTNGPLGTDKVVLNFEGI